MKQKNKILNSIGLMSGTSMDGVDLAFIKSNGKELIERKSFAYLPYEKSFKNRLSNLIYGKPTLHEVKSVENELTLIHANMVNDFIINHKINRSEIDIISFHGHTIVHDPKNLITWQLGNGHLLAQQTGIDVISDFRSKDVVHGGQGAPLVPIYHFYLFANQAKPAAILNIGGISNITYINQNNEFEIEAFDVCYGNAPLDDLMKKRLGCDFDKNGELASQGNINHNIAERILRHDIFYKKPTKSFDRDDFSQVIKPVEDLEVADALATLIYIQAKVLEINLRFFKELPKEIFICGGGRKNLEILKILRKELKNITIRTVEEIGFNGDAIEAEAFAFLGIRAILDLPISFYRTTGVKKASTHETESSGSFQKHPHSSGGILFRS